MECGIAVHVPIGGIAAELGVVASLRHHVTRLLIAAVAAGTAAATIAAAVKAGLSDALIGH
jgi:hypothetical protein